MATELIQHVVIKRDARRDIGLPGAIEIDRNLDRSFLGAAGAACETAHIKTPQDFGTE
jgi:hypothetical protein